MKRYITILALAVAAFVQATPANALPQRLIVRDKLGLKGLQKTCLLLGCNITGSLGDPLGQVFLVVVPNLQSLNKIVSLLPVQVGIVGVEVDELLGILEPNLGAIPAQLSDTIPVNYYGHPVWHGYLTQPANQIIRTSQTQSAFHVSGAGVVAIIDTGIDAQHPALSGVVLSGL